MSAISFLRRRFLPGRDSCKSSAVIRLAEEATMTPNAGRDTRVDSAPLD